MAVRHTEEWPLRYTVVSFFNNTLLPVNREHAEDWEAPVGRITVLDGYQPGDQLVESMYRVTGEGAQSENACEHAFHRLNADNRPNGNLERSLSVGDVVRVETQDEITWFACERVGFKQIEPPYGFQDVNEA